MRFLIDNALSPKLAELLSEDDYDTVHVRDVGLQHASDQEIFQYALENKRIIVSADTDFGLLLSFWNKNEPSVIIFRKGAERDPYNQKKLFDLNLNKSLIQAIDQGSKPKNKDKKNSHPLGKK